MKNSILITQKKIFAPDYPNSFFKYLSEIEKVHFWHFGRNNLIEKLIKTHIDKDKSFLEVGVGSGGVIDHLVRTLNLSATGVDVNLTALKLANKKNPKAKYVYADIYKNKFRGKYKFVALFDVIEHIEDDVRFIKTCKKYMKTDGYLIITVPADMKLWSNNDLASHHKRRYTKATLKETLEKSGLKVIFMSYFGVFYYPLLKLLRKDYEKYDKSNKLEILKKSLNPPVAPVNAILKLLFLLENMFIMNLKPSFGSSLIVMASIKQKP